MEKQLLLLVSLLLPLISGCVSQVSEEPTPEIVYNYKESIHTEMSASMYQYTYESEPVVNSWVGFDSLKYYTINDIFYIKVSDEKYDYYTCGYMKSEIYDKLSEYTYSPIANKEYGIDNSLAKYNRFLTHNEKNDNPIKWYDVKIDSTIPLEIDGYTLVIINSLVKMDVFDFSYNYVDSFIIMHEKASFKEYDIGDEDRDEQIQYENFISNYIKDSICLQMSSLLVYDKIISASFYRGYIDSAFGLFIEERDNDSYVTIYALNENDYVLNGHNALQDIPNTNLSTERDIKYEFNVKDLISFIKNSL